MGTRVQPLFSPLAALLLRPSLTYCSVSASLPSTSVFFTPFFFLSSAKMMLVRGRLCQCTYKLVTNVLYDARGNDRKPVVLPLIHCFFNFCFAKLFFNAERSISWRVGPHLILWPYLLKNCFSTESSFDKVSFLFDIGNRELYALSCGSF